MSGRRRFLVLALVSGAALFSAPAALAQTAVNVNATYRALLGASTSPFGQVVGPNAHAVNCPDGAFGCGSGTAGSLGPFSWAAAPSATGGAQTASLTFTTGTLVIDENFQDANWPGNSLGQSQHSAGNVARLPQIVASESGDRDRLP